MYKLIFGLFLGLGLLAATAQPAQAFNLNWFWTKAVATPGHPITLEGQGSLSAHGRGKINYHVNDGQVTVNSGHGVVAVKGNPTVTAKGFGGTRQIGEWTYYFGRGKLTATGSNYDLLFWDKGQTKATGSGTVTFRGYWTIRYTGKTPINTHLGSVTVPNELSAEVSADANLD